MRAPARSVAVALSFLTACTPGTEGVGGSPAGPLDASLQVAPNPAPAGDSIRLSMEVTNRADTAAALEFTTGQRFDFVMRGDAGEVARWSADMMFTQVLGTETYPPSETRTLQAGMTAPPDPGEYTVVGWITSDNAEVRDSVTLTVVEPPEGGGPVPGG